MTKFYRIWFQTKHGKIFISTDNRFVFQSPPPTSFYICRPSRDGKFVSSFRTCEMSFFNGFLFLSHRGLNLKPPHFQFHFWPLSYNQKLPVHFYFNSLDLQAKTETTRSHTNLTTQVDFKIVLYYYNTFKYNELRYMLIC